MTDLLMWHDYLDGTGVKYHLKDAGVLTLCNWEGLDPGFWTIGTNSPPVFNRVCPTCAGLAEELIDGTTGVYDPRLEMIMQGFSNLQESVAAANQASETPPERNCSPFEMLEELILSTAALVDRIDKEEDITVALSELRETIKKSKGWILNELFPATRCLPYNEEN